MQRFHYCLHIQQASLSKDSLGPLGYQYQVDVQVHPWLCRLTHNIHGRYFIFMWQNFQYFLHFCWAGHVLAIPAYDVTQPGWPSGDKVNQLYLIFAWIWMWMGHFSSLVFGFPKGLVHLGRLDHLFRDKGGAHERQHVTLNSQCQPLNNPQNADLRYKASISRTLGEGGGGTLSVQSGSDWRPVALVFTTHYFCLINHCWSKCCSLCRNKLMKTIKMFYSVVFKVWSSRYASWAKCPLDVSLILFF